jgi:dipeptidyl aminopeptidase/acylaminoacyl peptidase
VRALAALLALLACAPLQARPIALDDIHRIEDVHGPALSRDGARLAYTLGTNNLDSDDAVSDIWLVDWDGGNRRNLSASAFHSEWNPLWHPDGSALAFLSDNTSDDKVQIVVQRLDGTQPRQLTRFPGGVVDFVWSPDGRRMAVIANDAPPSGGKDSCGKNRPPPPIEVDRYQFKEDTRDYLAGQRQRLYVLELASGKLELLSGADEDIWTPSWSPDGKLLAFVAKSGPEPDRGSNFDVFVMAPQAGAEPRRISTLIGADADPYWESRPQWSPDSRKLMWLQSGDDKWVYYEPWQLVVAELRSGRQSKPARIDRSFYHPRWSADGSRIYALIEHAESTWLARIDPASERIEYLTNGASFGYQFDIGADDRIVLAQSDDRSPLALYALEGEPRLLAGHNEWLEDVTLANTEKLALRSPDGTEVHALLTTPSGYDRSQPLPLIVRLHGGPVYQFSHEFMFDWQLYAAQGYAVLGVNPRGSSGRGFEFARAIHADWGNRDVQDVLAAVDHVVTLGIADPARLGLGGRSYGGILTNYVIASDGRFAAAVSEAGASNFLGMYGVDQYAAIYEHEIGTPWKNLQTWLKLSYPFLHADRIRTPTLFMCMQDDFNVPCTGSEQMYQALRSLDVPTGLVIYPGQNHQPTVPSYRHHRQQKKLEWYASRLKP